MPYSSSLTDKEWELIEPLLPQKKQTKPPRWTKRQILDGVFYQLKNGCNWCDLPKDLPPYKGGILALQAVARGWHSRADDDNLTFAGASTSQKKPKWTRLLMIDFGCGEKHLQCQCRIERVLSLQVYQWHQATSRR